MATRYDSAAFRASPFMRALGAGKVLPAGEHRAIARQQREDDDELSRIWHIRAAGAFHSALAASERHHLARVLCEGWRPGHPRTAGMQAPHDEAVSELIGAIEQWSKIPKHTAFRRKGFIKAVREYRRATICSGFAATWREREPTWLA